MRGLERLQLLEQRVVLGVRNLRRVEDVVGRGVVLQQLAQGRRAGGGRARHRRRSGTPSPRPRPAQLNRRRAAAVPAARSRAASAS